jgi:hypothetical protein
MTRPATTTCIVLVLLMTLQIASAGVPRLFQQKQFTAAAFAEAVNHFVAIGEDASVRELRGLALDDAASRALRGKDRWSANERIGWMCRVLFEPSTDTPLRPPAFGGLALPEHSMPAADWPLYPVAHSGSTYFVLGEGYLLAGRAEDPIAYIAYSQRAGIFRTHPIAVPDRAQAMKDAAALRQSAAWKAIQWTDRGENWSYTLSESSTWEFILDQAKDMR